MKKRVLIVPVMACALLVACKKENHGSAKLVTIDTTIASGAEFQLPLQPYGDADDVATITKQATSYSVSEITNADPSVFSSVYHYMAVSKGTLNDQVVLHVTEGLGNHPHKGDSTVVTINFTVK